MRMLAKKDEVKKVEAKNQKPEVKTVDNNREKEIKKLKSEIEKSEQKIADLETKIAETDKKLADQSKFHELTKDPSFFSNYESLKKQLEAEMANWEKLSGQL